MDERGGLQGVTIGFAGHFVIRDLPQFFIHDGQQFTRVGGTMVDRLENLSEIVHEMNVTPIMKF